jgi:probable HAF family extracellular repeat protein
MALFIALAVPVQLAAQERKEEQRRYKLIDLGTLGGPNSFVNGPGTADLSNQGTYVGEAETSIPDPFAPKCLVPECLVQHAQKWRDGVVTDLGALSGINNSSGATWISANGRFISGSSENGVIDPLLGVAELRAVVWKADQIFDLGTLEGGNESFAAAVNSRGQVIGIAANTIPDPFSMFCFIVCATTQQRAFLWQDGVMQDLGTLGGPDAGADLVNERGQIAGHSYTNSTPNSTTGIPTQDPFLWEKGTIVDLGTLGGTFGFPNWLNSRGQVVGTSNVAGDHAHHPFFWERGVLTDIGTFGGSNGEALRISDSGLVVGTANFAGDFIHHARLEERRDDRCGGCAWRLVY